MKSKIQKCKGLGVRQGGVKSGAGWKALASRLPTSVQWLRAILREAPDNWYLTVHYLKPPTWPPLYRPHALHLPTCPTSAYPSARPPSTCPSACSPSTYPYACPPSTCPLELQSDLELQSGSSRLNQLISSTRSPQHLPTPPTPPTSHPPTRSCSLLTLTNDCKRVGLSKTGDHILEHCPVQLWLCAV